MAHHRARGFSQHRRSGLEARGLDAVFDEDAVDIVDQLDQSSARRPQRDVQRVNIDFTVYVDTSLDVEAARLGITRQTATKTWIAEHLDRHAS